MLFTYFQGWLFVAVLLGQSPTCTDLFVVVGAVSEVSATSQSLLKVT